MSEDILHKQELDFLRADYVEIRREFANIMGDPNASWVDVVDAKNGLQNARNVYHKQIVYKKDLYKSRQSFGLREKV